MSAGEEGCGFLLSMYSPFTDLDGGCMGVPGLGYPQR